MNLIIDVGNTRVKVAVFKDITLVELFFVTKKNLVLELKNIVTKFNIQSSILSNVAHLDLHDLAKIKSFTNLYVLSSDVKLPFKNHYKTPSTLGADRIALVAAAQHHYPKHNVLVIDAGTCITYDFKNKKSEYLGGAISPGIEMRFQSLHQFTSKLPLVKKESSAQFIGQSTQTSINSGVVNGILQEIDGVINQYKRQFLDLTVVLTGGDTNFLGKQLKSSIFANQNFLLEGLNILLIHIKAND